MLKNFAAICTVAFFSLVSSAAETVAIGAVSLQPNMANQIVTIPVTGGEQTAGMNLYLQIGGGSSGPTITAVNLATNTIWTPTAPIAGDLGGSDARTVFWQVVTGSGTVSANGSLAHITVDTTGLTTGTFPLSLTVGGFSSEILNGNGESLTTTLIDGTLVIVTPTNPELDITRSGSAVADGGTDSVTATVAATVQSLTYVLTNSGTATLAVTTPVVVGSQTNCTATVTTQPSNSLVAAATSSLIVAVTPTATGAWSFTLSVVNSDSSENPYNWTASGTATAGPAPELDITRSGSAVADGGTDDIVHTLSTTPVSLTYILTNNGSGTVAITTPIIPSTVINCSATVTTQPASSISPGNSSSLVISVIPATADSWSFDILIDNTDTDESPYNWLVVATAESTESSESNPFSVNVEPSADSGSCGLGGLSGVLLSLLYVTHFRRKT